MTTQTYRAYEDNAGGLHLAILHGDDCVAFFSGFEQQSGALSGSIEVLAVDPGDWRVWDGHDVDPEEAYFLHSFNDDLIATEQGVYPGRMGVAGREDFGITEDDLPMTMPGDTPMQRYAVNIEAHPKQSDQWYDGEHTDVNNGIWAESRDAAQQKLDAKCRAAGTESDPYFGAFGPYAVEIQ